MHTTAQLKRWIEWVDPGWIKIKKWKALESGKVDSLNGLRIWLKLFRELQWNENMVINAICDAALSGLLDWRQFWNQTMFLSNFGKREENAKLPSLITHLNNKKTPNGASALSLSLDRLPLGPSYLKSCVQIGQINKPPVPSDIRKEISAVE